jgi:hypothetical protein
LLLCDTQFGWDGLFVAFSLVNIRNSDKFTGKVGISTHTRLPRS